jgi:hypothetical protein
VPAETRPPAEPDTLLVITHPVRDGVEIIEVASDWGELEARPDPRPSLLDRLAALWRAAS